MGFYADIYQLIKQNVDAEVVTSMTKTPETLPLVTFTSPDEDITFDKHGGGVNQALTERQVTVFVDAENLAEVLTLTEETRNALPEHLDGFVLRRVVQDSSVAAAGGDSKYYNSIIRGTYTRE